MYKLPSMLFVTDRGHFCAYTSENGSLRPVDTMQMDEALKKISDQMTDQLGGFPSAESQGEGNSTGERLPLKEELELRSVRQIAQRINELVKDHGAKDWGLVAAPEIHQAILDRLDNPTRERLTVGVKKNLANQPPGEICKQVLAA